MFSNQDIELDRITAKFVASKSVNFREWQLHVQEPRHWTWENNSYICS